MYKLLKNLWGQISANWRKQIGLLLLLMLIASFAEFINISAVLPFLGALTAPEKVYSNELLQPLIRLLGITNPKDLLLPMTIIFCLVSLVSGGIRLALLWVQTRLSFVIGADLSLEIYRRTLYQPYAHHVARNSSEVITGITHKINEVVGQILIPLLQIIGAIVMVVTITITLVIIDPFVALTTFLGFSGIYGMIMMATKRTLIRNSRRISTMTTHRVKTIQEGLGGIRDVLLDGTQGVYCQAYMSVDRPLRNAKISNIVISGSPRFCIEVLGMVLFAALACSYILSGKSFLTVFPVLGTLVIGATRLIPTLQICYNSWSRIRGAQEILVDSLELLEQYLPDSASEERPEPMLFTSKISVNQLGFRYVDNGPKVLNHLNLDIAKGSRIGFIGVTGSGKSTLIDIIMGLLTPSEGDVLIDSVPINDSNRRSWQEHLAHVPQAIFLADASIAENIALGVPADKIDRERMRLVAEKAQIASTIESWDKGYDTSVGEQGVRLSGGQCQRIGIARALYKQADVIILDEATSALDSETERAVMSAIDNISREITILIIAHRVSTLKQCDVLFEIDDGRIKRSGTYDDIFKGEA